MSFENKVVLVSGSGSGIGEATATLFAKEGANVVIVDCNEETANKTADKCRKFGKRVLVVKTDLCKDDEAKNSIEKTINKFGRLDVLVNNEGTNKEGNLIFGNIMDTYDVLMNTNLRSLVFMTSLATPHLIKTKGCIVNTASILSTYTKLGLRHPIYSVSKAGVICFTQLSALELAPHGVRVNAVNPGPVYTNILVNSGVGGTFDELIDSTALKRCLDPPEIASMIVYLASDKAKSITGSIYDLDSGMKLM